MAVIDTNPNSHRTSSKRVTRIRKQINAFHSQVAPKPSKLRKDDNWDRSTPDVGHVMTMQCVWCLGTSYVDRKRNPVLRPRDQLELQ